MKRENQNKHYRVRVITLIIVFRNISNISSNHTSQTYVHDQAICCTKFLFKLLIELNK